MLPMLHQTQLPLANSPTGPIPHPSFTDRSLRRSSVSRALRRASNTGWSWGLDPYRGKRFPSTAEPVAARMNLPAVLRSELAVRDLRGQPIRIGAFSEPYPRCEATLRLTANTLREFETERGLDLSIVTRSDLILRDLERLKRLDLDHTILVLIAIPTVDAALAARLEPSAPTPRQRLDVVSRLAIEGITAKVLCDPFVPEINGDLSELRPLFEKAKAAGAVDLLVRGGASDRTHRWVARNCPDLLSQRGSVGDSRTNGDSQSHCGRAVGNHSHGLRNSTFHRLRLAYGFPQNRIGRG